MPVLRVLGELKGPPGSEWAASPLHVKANTFFSITYANREISDVENQNNRLSQHYCCWLWKALWYFCFRFTYLADYVSSGTREYAFAFQEHAPSGKLKGDDPKAY